MSKGNRRFLFILGAIAALCAVIFALGVYLEPRCLADSAAWKTDGETEHSDPRTSDSAQVICNADCGIHFDFAESAEPTGDGEDHAESKNHPANKTALPPVEERDLCAQTRVAWWTRIIAFFTAIGAALLFWTIVETRREIETGRTLLQEQGALENRAWVLPVDGSLFELITDTARPHGDRYLFVFSTAWRNIGKTPAKNALLRRDMFFQNAADDIPRTVTWQPHSEDFEKAIIPPGLRCLTTRMILDRNQMKAIARREKRLFLVSQATYDTIYPSIRNRSSIVCLEVTIHASEKNFDGEGLLAQNLEPIFSYVPIGPLNDAN